MILAAFLAFVVAQPVDAAPAAAPAAAPSLPTLVPFPHPLITEVLYAVPGKKDGDADGDGVRSATGDEFVELVNPHDKPISLKGYTLTDGKNLRPPEERKAKKPETKSTPTAPTKPVEEDDSRVRFVFPDLTLQPGQVVVVFNGYKASGTTPVPPKAEAKNPDGSAIRLSMDAKSEYVAFGNGGDCVLLTAPDGKGVQCISWGEQPKPPETVAPFVEEAFAGKGSVTRLGLTRGLHAHVAKFGTFYSPGVFDVKVPVDGEKRGK